jgi:hypothetical protein
VTEGEFWKISPSRQKEYAAAKSHIAFMLGRALEDKLVTHADIVEGITVEELASRLPKSELGKIIKGALECGKRNAPFTETDLLGSMPPDVLVNYMPLFQVWDSIIETKIAFEHGYATKKKGDKTDSGDHPSATNNTLGSSSGSGIGAGTLASASAAGGTLTMPGDDDMSPSTSNDDDFGAFAPPTSRTQTDKVSAADMTAAKDFKASKDQKDNKEAKDAKAGAGKGSRPKTPPPPLPPVAGAKPVEDPSTWSQEFDEDTEFVDAADLLDEEPTINSKGGLGKENTV